MTERTFAMTEYTYYACLKVPEGSVYFKFHNGPDRLSDEDLAERVRRLREELGFVVEWVNLERRTVSRLDV